MPIEWGVSRRGFMKHAGLWAAGWGIASSAHGASPATASVALLSDTHIAADPATLRGDVNMSANLKRVTEDLLACPSRPAHVLINGDCAFLDGQAGDYVTLIEHLKPIREQGRGVILNLGNHDDRSSFRTAFEGFKLPESPVTDKQATVLDVGPVRWFLLDSLEVVNQTPGSLGDKQLRWLDESLRKSSDKPALVMAHHNVDMAKLLPKGEVLAPLAKNRLPVPGLTDGDRLLEVLTGHKHVSGYFFGHTHQWNALKWEGIAFVNLPCVAYPFTPVDPNGWVLAQSDASQTVLELCALDPKHPAYRQKITLPHRAG